MKLSAQFDYQQVDHEKDNIVRLLVTVEAPPIDWIARRPRVCVLPVLDVSGSMEGAKFDYALQACRKLVEQLQPGDYSGLVTFGYGAKVVVKPAEVTPEFKTRLLQALKALVPSGGTNFSEAVKESLTALGGLDLPPSVLQRAIFFTDGQPTSGLTDPVAIKELVVRNLRSCSMSFFGYGGAKGGTCNQEFLTELSEVGKGNYAYVQNPDEALAAFGRELGGLLSTYATDLRVLIEPRNGHSVEKVVTTLSQDRQLSSAIDVTELVLELGDILAEEQRHVVFECLVKKQDKALPRDFTVFNVKTTCRRVNQDGDKEAEEAVEAAKIRFVRAADVQKVPTPEVDQIIALHQLARAQHEAEAQAAKGLYVEAQRVLKSFSEEVKTRGYIHVANVANGLGARMASSAEYGSTQGYRKSLENGLLRSAKVSNYEASALADLGNLPLAGNGTLGTSAQSAYSSLFTTGTSSEVAGVMSAAPVPRSIIHEDPPAEEVKPLAAPLAD